MIEAVFDFLFFPAKSSDRLIFAQRKLITSLKLLVIQQQEIIVKQQQVLENLKGRLTL